MCLVKSIANHVLLLYEWALSSPADHRVKQSILIFVFGTAVEDGDISVFQSSTSIACCLLMTEILKYIAMESYLSR